MIATIFTTAVVTAVTVTAFCVFVGQWRDGRAVIRLTQDEFRPIPYWPAENSEILATHAGLLALLCWRCNDGIGACICSSQCGAQACTGGFSGQDFSDWDEEWLRGLGITEETDQ